MPIIIAPEPWRSEAGHAPRTGFTSPAFTASWHSSSTGEPMNVTAWPSSPARLHRGRGNAGKNLPSPCGGTVRSAFGRLNSRQAVSGNPQAAPGSVRGFFSAPRCRFEVGLVLGRPREHSEILWVSCGQTCEFPERSSRFACQTKTGFRVCALDRKQTLRRMAPLQVRKRAAASLGTKARAIDRKIPAPPTTKTSRKPMPAT